MKVGRAEKQNDVSKGKNGVADLHAQVNASTASLFTISTPKELRPKTQTNLEA